MIRRPCWFGIVASLLCAGFARPASAEIWEGVSHVETNVPTQFAGLNVNQFLGAERFYDAGYTGTRSTVANIEAGHVWNQHQDLGHTNFIPNAPNTASATTGITQYDKHATWVASHIAGRGAGTYATSSQEYRWGIAHGSNLYSGALASGWNGTPYALSFNFYYSDVAQTYGAAFVNGMGPGGTGPTADVVNSSWGSDDRDGFEPVAVGIDAMINQSGKIGVFSAGNSGSGTNTVGSPANGYNTIAVAALQNGGNNSYNSAASFSSRGPSDWWHATSPTGGFIDPTIRRAPVDIAAPGTNLTAAWYDGTTGGNTGGTDSTGGATNFYTYSVAGTSFASPITAGAAALIVDAGKDLYAGNGNAIDARVVKAVMLNSADKTAGWNNGQAVSGGVITTSQSLDYTVGAGRLNLDRTFDQYVSIAGGGLAGTTDLAGALGGVVQNVGWDFGTVAEGLSNVYTVSQTLMAGTDLTATLTWFVERTASFSNLSNAVEAHFANLDLRVFRIDDVLGQVLIAQSNSIANVVEHLFFTIPTTGLYGFEVVYTGDNWDFVGRTSEDYALAWSSTATPAAVPEPSSLTLCLLLAMSCAVIVRVRKRVAPC